MFKIPSYDELERGEKANSNKMSAQSLFQKQKEKNQLLDDSMRIDAPQTSASSAPKTSAVISSAPPVASATASGGDDDDDDELLNMFIQENKDIIEKPTTSSKSSPTARSDEPFKMPAAVPPNENAPAKPTSTASTTTTTTTTTTRSTYQYSGGGPMLVNSKQKGNPILKHVRNVQWKYSDTLVPDYSMSKTSCAFYLSMKYHLLNPTYIHQRIRDLGNGYNLRVLLAFVDIKEPNHCIKELEKICIHAHLTLILCWSNEEAGRYLETYKAFEFKGADLIMEKSTNATVASTGPSASSSNANANAVKNEDVIFANNFTDFLCQIKSVNKTDASTLRQTFGSIYEIAKAPKEQLSLCPGLGPSKVQRIYDTFRAPFRLADDKSAQK